MIEKFFNDKNVKKLLAKSNFILDATKTADVDIFRKIIEISMKNCLWNGVCGLS
jgi:hypothetical protein